MIDVLYDHMGIPDTCHLGKRVYKKLFHENAQLGVTDKRAFRDDIDVITWVYTLKPNTIAIQAYEDDEREYHEVAVLQIDAKTQLRTNRIAQIIHRAIPYPIVAVFAYRTACALSLAHKRFSQAEKGAIVADDFCTTDWFDLSTPSEIHRAFLSSLSVADLPHTHFLAFYSGLFDRLIALDCARLTGRYRIEAAAERRETRQQCLAQCRDLESRIAEVRAAAKREKQISRLTELNVEIRRLQGQLAKLTTNL